jgi:hypothetical protein
MSQQPCARWEIAFRRPSDFSACLNLNNQTALP